MIRSIRVLYEWLTLLDYEAAKDSVLAQDGSSMEQDELDELSAAADVAIDKIERRLSPALYP